MPDEKLKTLEDLKHPNGKFDFNNPDDLIIGFEDAKYIIRQEAIKWLKYGRSWNCEPNETQWKAFFGIMDEDLL